MGPDLACQREAKRMAQSEEGQEQLSAISHQLIRTERPLTTDNRTMRQREHRERQWAGGSQQLAAIQGPLPTGLRTTREQSAKRQLREIAFEVRNARRWFTCLTTQGTRGWPYRKAAPRFHGPALPVSRAGGAPDPAPPTRASEAMWNWRGGSRWTTCSCPHPTMPNCGLRRHH